MDNQPISEEYLTSLIAFAKSADLEEMVWEKEDQRIAFKRRVGAAPAPAAPRAGGEPARAPAAPVSKNLIVRSPMVGTFRRAPEGRPPLVMEGDEVVPGEKIALVEAMKVPKDVISDVGGRIVKVLVENGKPVEYGQKLFEIERS